MPRQVDSPYYQLRSRRKRAVRARTISVKRMTKRELELGRQLYPEAVDRPLTRAECKGSERPCPFVGCSHHLYLDVSIQTGAIKLNFPDLEPDQMAHSCVLDEADGGGMTLEAAGEILNVTRERLRQIEVAAYAKLAAQPGVPELFANFLGSTTGEAEPPLPRRHLPVVSLAATPIAASKAEEPKQSKPRRPTRDRAKAEPKPVLQAAKEEPCTRPGCWRPRAKKPTDLPGAETLCGPHRAGVWHAMRNQAGLGAPARPAKPIAVAPPSDVYPELALEAFRIVETIGWGPGSPDREPHRHRQCRSRPREGARLMGTRKQRTGADPVFVIPEDPELLDAMINALEEALRRVVAATELHGAGAVDAHLVGMIQELELAALKQQAAEGGA